MQNATAKNGSRFKRSTINAVLAMLSQWQLMSSWEMCPNTAGGSLWHRRVSGTTSLHVGKQRGRKRSQYEDDNRDKNLVCKPAVNSRVSTATKKLSSATTAVALN